MLPSVLYIPYAKSSHEHTGDIITFAQFEDGDLVENGCNAEEDESISDSIDELSTDDESEDRSMSTNALKDNRYVSQIHPDINARYARLKICERIRKM